MKLYFLIFIPCTFLFIPADTRRIVGGENSELGMFPWHVKIEPFDGYTRSLCGGALIKYNWIITAGQCIVSARDIIIRLGVVDRTGHQSAAFWLTNRQHFFVHDEYSAIDSIYENDIGMIYVQEATEKLLMDDFIDVVSIPTESFEMTGRIGIVTGFGFTNDQVDRTQSRFLQFVDMTVISTSQCRQVHGNSVITDGHFCTAGTSGRSTCVGDEGGPFVTVLNNINTLVGVGSTPLEVCTQGYPAIFTNLIPYLDWIYDHLNDPSPPPGPGPEPENGKKCNCICNCYTCPPLAEGSRTKVGDFWRK